MREATSTGLKKAIRERIFTKFGWPKKIILDNGSQFTSKDFIKFLKENYYVLHILTPPYSPQCNSTERVNRTVNTMIKIYLRDNQKKCDDQLPEIQFAINTAVQESTGFSAAEMNFGRNLKPPRSFFEDQTGQFSDPYPGVEQNRLNIEEILELARKNLTHAQQKQARYFNKKRRGWHPKINEVVYKREFPQSKAAEGFAAKLAPNFSGPYRVKSYLSPNILEVQQDASPSGNSKTYRVHVKDLKQLNQGGLSSPQ